MRLVSRPSNIDLLVKRESNPIGRELTCALSFLAPCRAALAYQDHQRQRWRDLKHA